MDGCVGDKSPERDPSAPACGMGPDRALRMERARSCPKLRHNQGLVQTQRQGAEGYETERDRARRKELVRTLQRTTKPLRVPLLTHPRTPT